MVSHSFTQTTDTFEVTCGTYSYQPGEMKLSRTSAYLSDLDFKALSYGNKIPKNY